MPEWGLLAHIAGVVTPLGVGGIWILRLVIRDENRKQTEKINGTYMRTTLANEKFLRLHERIDLIARIPHRGGSPSQGD